MDPSAADPDPGDELDELVEWIDASGRVIEVVARSRMRRENLRHRSAAVVILSTEGRLLVHRRADTKDLRPGFWDVCVGGVVGVGESYEQAARRELAEEVGVVDVPLEPLGDGRFDDHESRELSRLYRATSDGPFIFADGEVTAARFVGPAELRTLMQCEPFLPSCEAMVLPLVAGFEPR